MFSFLLFPYMAVTVMLYSIPLTMLGGWLYGYRGALITTVVTIPYHYLMLNYYSDDPAVLIETVNVFGIATQLFFSSCTALLKSNKERYIHLNSSLETFVEERTSSLRLLTEYLIEAEEAERKKTTENLLEGPLDSLKGMMGISTLLIKHLEEVNHPRLPQAQIINEQIHKTTMHLQNINHATKPASTAPEDFEKTITNLADQLTAISGSKVEMQPNCKWDKMKGDITEHIYHILHEALNNAVRHGEASNITVGVEESPNAITVYVQNDGTSIPTENQEGMGLPLMRYRAARIGASLTLEGGPGQDTVLKCRIPRKIVS